MFISGATNSDQNRLKARMEGLLKMDAKLYEQLFWASVSLNGFLGTWFLAGIKSYLRGLRKDISELKEEQMRQNEKNLAHEYRIVALEADYKDLPCMNNKECAL